ncbi:hypothetical protein ANCCAN_28949 [Ancylostoma caninum]|uniref:Uncharacterized protein n=1 Tax=Ancylostoma caninum TaxID=29170 RepID=A0A368F2V1_ANCCA|nr:hypothetical protein ANCCAN_28949 [Ancylostoma caninum]
MDRKQQFQESVNKKVLLEWVRITGLPNPRKKPFDKVLNEFAVDVLKYPKEKALAFAWPTAAGQTGSIVAMRAKVSYDFWRHFITEGRGLLAEYNKNNSLDIRIQREQTLHVSDTERLGLFIRRFIREAYNKANRKCPDILFKKGILQIGKEYHMTPTMAAYQFGINLEEWNGLPLEELFTPKESEAIKKGEVTFGSLRLTGVSLTRNHMSQQNTATNKENESNNVGANESEKTTSNSLESEAGRKRPTSDEVVETVPWKIPKKV